MAKQVGEASTNRAGWIPDKDEGFTGMGPPDDSLTPTAVRQSFALQPPQPPSGRSLTVLEEADGLTSGDRRMAYGHPRDNFKMIAQMFTALLGILVSERMVGRLMVAMKMARDVNQPKRDNLVDGAGYCRTMEMLDE